MTDITGGQDASDEDLMLSYAQGDAAAFEQLYARHRRVLLGYLVRQLRDQAVAEEIYQEAWMRVIRAREGYQVSAAFRTWLFTIAHNLVLDHYRRQGRRAELVLADGDELPDLADTATPPPEDLLAGRQDAEQLLACIGALPFAQRDVVLLRLEAGLTPAEIVAVTGADPEAVKSRLRYAVQRLRKELQDGD